MTFSGSLALYAGAGAGAFLIGLGIFYLCLRAGNVFSRLNRTLDEVDQQISVLSVPIVTTLTHVGGIADTADTTLARLAGLVEQLENVATGATKTANLIGSTISGVTSAMTKKPREDGKDH
ncbi:MAG: hypothetical protein GIW95_03320 [Candidatus Eremiobacteraeota bacterium]|nr:hypothetical protein [Candidatus Eremiobacteraeota bacterium]